MKTQSTQANNEVRKAASEASVSRAVQAEPGINLHVLADRTGLRRATAITTARRLEAEGRLIRIRVRNKVEHRMP